MAFRFPTELAQAIEARAKATGRDKTAVVVEALTQAFGLPLPSPAPVTVEALQEQLSQLEVKIAIGSKQLAELYQATSTDSSTLHLITALAQTITASSDLKAATPISVPDAPASQKPADEIPELQRVTEEQQREEMLEEILSAIPDPIFVCDRIGRFTYVNSAGTQALGMNRSQFLGRTCQELGLTSNLVARQIQECETVFATGQHITGESSISTIFEGTRRYEYILSPIQSTSGNIDAVLCTARDITKRQQAEMALRKSEASYRHLFESANDGILVLDASNRHILNANWNAARRLGYTRSELLQLSGADIFVPTADNSVEDIFRELLMIGSLIFKYFQRCKDGALILVESSSRTIEYEGRLAIQSCVRDISDR